MFKKMFVWLTVVISLAAVPTNLLAGDRRDFTPPAQRGKVYIVVRFTGAASIVPKNVQAKVVWGSWNQTGSFNSGGGRVPKEGFVIRLNHAKNDSVQLTVTTSGETSIERISQGEPPSEWSNGNYNTASW